MNAIYSMCRSTSPPKSPHALPTSRDLRTRQFRALIGIRAVMLTLLLGFLSNSAWACSCWRERGPEYWIHSDAVVVATALTSTGGVPEPADPARRHHADFLVSEVLFGMLVPGSVISIDGESGMCSLGAIRGMIYLMRLSRDDGGWSAGHCTADFVGFEGEQEPWMSELDFSHGQDRLLRARDVLNQLSSQSTKDPAP